MVSESITFEIWTDIDLSAELRILFSGGIESAVLMGEAIEAGLNPIPVYISTAARWEDIELGYAKGYLEALQSGLSDKMEIIESIPADLEDHWAYNGKNYPAAGDDVQALKIPGRNETLLRETASFGGSDRKMILAIGTTADNPFKDGKRQFFSEMETILSAKRGEQVTILAPFAELKKCEVIDRGKRFPLGLTLSCIAPHNGKACGSCIKCASRAKAFSKTDLIDKHEKERLNEY